jgi:hypothetical protein
METPAVETRIKWASLLIGSGLLVQVLALFRIHPLAFVAFLVIGCPLVAAGILIYLISLVSPPRQNQ